LSRTIRIPACVLSVDDLRKLFIELDSATREVTGAQIDELLRSLPVTTAVDHTRLTQAKDDAGVSMFVGGKNGEQVILHDAGAITRDALPDGLVSITFDSAARFRTSVGSDPINRFKLVLDFTEPSAVVGYDPWNQPTPNASGFEIIGADQTWVAGISDKVMNFLDARKRSRLWLHAVTTFALYQWIIAIPATFWVLHRLDTIVQPLVNGLPTVIRSGLYIYIFLLVLLLFRVLIYVLRWVFPIVELQGSRRTAIRATISAIEIGVLSALIYDVLKAIL
jgi:hypothetical protein